MENFCCLALGSSRCEWENLILHFLIFEEKEKFSNMPNICLISQLDFPQLFNSLTFNWSSLWARVRTSFLSFMKPTTMDVLPRYNAGLEMRKFWNFSKKTINLEHSLTKYYSCVCHPRIKFKRPEISFNLIN